MIPAVFGGLGKPAVGSARGRHISANHVRKHASKSEAISQIHRVNAGLIVPFLVLCAALLYQRLRGFHSTKLRDCEARIKAYQ